MKDMNKMLGLWDGFSVGVSTDIGNLSHVHIPKPMYVQYIDSKGAEVNVLVPSFLQQHKCYGAGRGVDGTIYAMYAGAWEFPFTLFVGSSGVLYPEDAYFTFKEMKTLFKMRALFGEDDEENKLYLSLHHTRKPEMKLVTRAGRDVEPLENMIQVYAGIEPASSDLGDADDDGWDGVGRFR